MDNDTDVSEVQHGERKPGTICALTRIIPAEWPGERLEWIWKQILTQDYAFDDFAKANPQVFLGKLFDPNTEAYEIGDVGFVMLESIIPQVNAVIHFVMWEDIEIRDLISIQRELFKQTFEYFHLNRLTAFIPGFNKKALRYAHLGGFKYEGEMRQIYLKHGKFHNLQIFGLLHEEWVRREGKVVN